MIENISVPFNRCYWVVPGKLMAGCYPGDLNENEAGRKLCGLLDHGIRHVVSLMEPGETDHSGGAFEPYEPVMKAIAVGRGIDVSFSRFPIRDLSVPADSGMSEILDHIDRIISDGNPVYVHCWGGRGRTGTVVGCYLSRHGIASGRKVLFMIQKLRKKAADYHLQSPETVRQMDMVVSWGRS